MNRETYKLKDELSRGNVLPVLLEDCTWIDMFEGRTEEGGLVVDLVGVIGLLIDTKEGESLEKVLLREVVADWIRKIALLRRCRRSR